MKKKISPTIIGAFVIASFLVLAVVIILLGSGRIFSKVDTVIAYFEGSLQGLSVGAPVKYNGVTVGEVKEIRIDIKASDYQISMPVLIDLIPGGPVHVIGKDLDESYSDEFLKLMVARGLRATLKLQSMVTGKLYIDLGFHEKGEPVFRDTGGKYVEIPTVPSSLQQITDATQALDIKALVDKGMNILASFENLTTMLSDLLSNPESAEGLKSVFSSIEELQTLLVTLNDEIPKLGKDLKNGLQQLVQVSDEVSVLVENLDSKIGPAADELSSALTRVEEAADSIDKLAGEVSSLDSSNSPVLAEVNRALQEVSDAAHSIRVLSDRLYRDPNMLLFGNSSQRGNDDNR